jgi:hypothetical protein
VKNKTFGLLPVTTYVLLTLIRQERVQCSRTQIFLSSHMSKDSDKERCSIDYCCKLLHPGPSKCLRHHAPMYQNRIYQLLPTFPSLLPRCSTEDFSLQLLNAKINCLLFECHITPNITTTSLLIEIILSF